MKTIYTHNQLSQAVLIILVDIKQVTSVFRREKIWNYEYLMFDLICCPEDDIFYDLLLSQNEIKKSLKPINFDSE